MSMGGGNPLFGGGGYFNPQGPHGPWGGCGCGSLLIILAGILLVCGGMMNFMGGH